MGLYAEPKNITKEEFIQKYCTVEITDSVYKNEIDYKAILNTKIVVYIIKYPSHIAIGVCYSYADYYSVKCSKIKARFFICDKEIVKENTPAACWSIYMED